MGTAKKTVQYRYDASGNRTLVIDPDGGRLTSSYDGLNRITHLINPQNERTSFSYDAANRRTLTRLANGTRCSYSYDASSRLTRVANLTSAAATLSSFDYRYDKAGNRTAQIENDGSRVTYSYDGVYQLKGEHRTGTTPYRNTFTYDAAGNRTLKNEGGSRTTYSYDTANQLIYSQDSTGRTTYTFDNDGNQTRVLEPSGNRTTTTWDFENKSTLVRLSSGVRNTMAYDTEGLRIKLEDSSGTRKFVWDRQNYLAETNASNDTQVVYTNEPTMYGKLISQRRSSTTSWFHYDALGSTRQLTNSSQTVTDTYLYDAWGSTLASTGSTVNPFRYVGRLGYYADLDTLNYYIRARNYRPSIARWLSTDPLGFVDGLNRYRAYFVPNSFDPSGLANDGVLICSDGHQQDISRDISPAVLTAINNAHGGCIVHWHGEPAPQPLPPLQPHLPPALPKPTSTPAFDRKAIGCEAGDWLDCMVCCMYKYNVYTIIGTGIAGRVIGWRRLKGVRWPGMTHHHTYVITRIGVRCRLWTYPVASAIGSVANRTSLWLGPIDLALQANCAVICGSD